jgi:hypothetical protein
MERSSQGAEDLDEEDVPNLGLSRPKKKGKDKGNKGDEAVGYDHHPFSVPAVHERSRKRPKEDLGKHGHQARCGQNRRRTGLLREPPNQGKLRDGATKEGKLLPYPNREKASFPISHHALQSTIPNSLPIS